MKYLIVTADDLGLTKSVNEGIARSCQEGIVTSVSIIPTGDALEDAVGLIRDLKLKDVGAHLALSETRPVLASSKFREDHNRFFLECLFGKVDLNNIYSELKSQLNLLKGVGIEITHINSHEHLHIMPSILDVFIRLAKEYKIPAIRYPRGDRHPAVFAVKEFYKKMVLSYFSKKDKKAFKDSGLFYTDYFFGLLDAGRLEESSLMRILKIVKEGTSELVCHPAFLSPEVLERYPWHAQGESEVFALTSKRVKKLLIDNGIKLTTFGELSSGIR